MSNNDNYQEILSKLDIVDIISAFISLTKKGQSYVALCPFHNDSNPSMSVDPRKQIFKCFVCGVGGNAISFITKYKKITFYEALEYLYENNKIDIDLASLKSQSNIKTYSEEELNLLKILEKANSLFHVTLMQNANKISLLNDFIKTRKLNSKLINRFDIGYASEPEFKYIFNDELTNSPHLIVNSSLVSKNNLSLIYRDRVTFAIRDEKNNIVGFSSRTLNPETKPKYINSPESSIFHKSSLLYNIYEATQKHIDKLIIVEGFFDVIALYKAGYENVVALMGTALTDKHLHLLKDYEIILFLDGDEAGINATLKSSLTLLKANKKVKIVHNASTHDPDEILNISGKSRIDELINNASPAIDFIYKHLIRANKIDENNSEIANFSKFNDEINPFLNAISESEKNFIIDTFYQKYQYKLTVKSAVKYEKKNQSHYIGEHELPQNYDFHPNVGYENNIINATNFDFYEPYTVKKDKKTSISKGNKNLHLLRMYYLLLKHPNLIDIFKNKNQENQKNIDIELFDAAYYRDEALKIELDLLYKFIDNFTSKLMNKNLNANDLLELENNFNLIEGSEKIKKEIENNIFDFSQADAEFQNAYEIALLDYVDRFKKQNYNNNTRTRIQKNNDVYHKISERYRHMFRLENSNKGEKDGN